MTTSKANWSELFFFAKGKWLISTLFGSLVIAAILGAFVPGMIAEVARSYDDTQLFEKSLWGLFFIFIGVYLNRVCYQLAVNKYVKLLVQKVRTLCYEKWLLHYDVQSSKKADSERYPQGEVLARIMSDTEAVRELITSGTFGIFIDLFFVVSCLVSFISMNTTSGIILASAQVSIAILLVWGSKYMRKIFLSVRKSSGQVSRTMANMVGGVRETYYTKHDNYASKRGEVVFEDFLTKQLTSNVWDASYYSVAESLYPLFLVLVVFIFPYSQITEAALVLAIVDLIQRSINPIKDIASKIANVQRAATGFYRIKEFLTDLQNGFSSPRDQVLAPLDFDSLKVDIPSFQYPVRKKSDDEDKEETRFAITDVAFEISRGQLVGIVGLSGCGKSTVLNLIAANIIPSAGSSITLIKDSQDVLIFPGERISDIIRYREQVGIVSQDSHIFSETLRFNITMSADDSPEFDIFWHKMCQEIPYLITWGHGPDDVLDQQALSVGQKQLLAAIRSCFLKKTIVLFDEIASGLDSELELALRKVVMVVQQKCLTFIVAHRLETIIEADLILVMEDGQIKARGNHAQLLNDSSAYQEFIAEMSHS